MLFAMRKPSSYGSGPGKISTSAPLATSAALLALLSYPVRGYDFLINDTAPGGYYTDILDGGTNEVIGGLYQDAVFDSTGERIGTNRGCAYYFDDVDGDPEWPWKYNVNEYMFLDGGDCIYLETYIVACTGKYERYTGGTLREVVISEDPNFVSELTLYERDDGPTTADDSGNGDAVMTAFRVTSPGAYYYSMIADQNNSEIGSKFQDLILDSSGNAVGVNQGFAYYFPNDTFINNLGYSSDTGNENRIFQFDNGEYILAIDDAIVYGSGPYQKFQGSIFLEESISTSPIYVSDITLVVDDETVAAGAGAGDASGGDAMLNVISEGGFHEAITDPETGYEIGARFQNPVLDPSTGERIGTNQGSGFYFPPAPYTRDVQYGNRHFFLKEGTFIIYNGVVVGANGIYKKYVGGIIQETVNSMTPYNSTILLVEPSAKDANSTGVGKEPQAEVDGSSANSNGGSHRQLGHGLLIISQTFLVLFLGIAAL
ncbi:hypothetical protein ACHAW5_009918 [Stephanodiscus triporus]|uniref:Uncharacterized protein n=1 Tax=Stephanodiscus triporus TaxID=2934178 RepID=A0ABD3QLN2_9STRA